MTRRLGAAADALTFHLVAHRRLGVVTVVLSGAGAAALSLAGGGVRAGVPSPGSPVMAAVVVLGLGVMAGAVGGEIRQGRAALWIGACGTPGRWLLRELGLRTAVVGVLVLGVVLAGMLALLPLDLDAARSVARGAPILAVLGLLLAAVGFGCSGVTERLDTLLASLYVFPFTFALAGVAVGWPDAARRHVLALAFPLDPLLSLAPGNTTTAASWTEPRTLAHLVMFWSAWVGVGLVGGWLRVRRRSGG